MIERTIVRIIHSNLSYCDGVLSLILAKAKIGKCHKYNEYEINPVPTNNFDDKIFVIISFLFENHIIKQTPITGIVV